MSRISGFPTGFLSLLDSKSFGEQPDVVGDAIVPTVDIGDLFLSTKTNGEVQVVAVPALGPNAGLRVPNGEVWKVQAGGIFVLAGAGVTLDLTPVVEVTGIITPIADTISVLASTTRMVTMKAAPFWLKAGAQLTAYVTALVGVPTISIAYVVSRLRV